MYLEKIPIIKDFREAYDRTIDEADEAIAEIETAIRDETISAISEHVRNIERLPNFDAESVEFRQPLALVGPTAISRDELSSNNPR